MKPSWWLLGAALLAATPALAQKAEEEAGDVSEVDKDAAGPLRERIRPVSGHLFLMEKRFEFSPNIGVSIRDAFFTKVLFGAAFTYHFTEAFALSLHGAYTASLVAGSAQICVPPNNPDGLPAGCRSPTWDELTKSEGTPTNKAWGLMTFFADLDLMWSPIYGKISLFAENAINFNMYGLIGPTVLMYGATNVITAGGNAGIGFRFIVNQWLSVRLEVRDIVYNEVGVQGLSTTNSVRNQLLTELGVSMFFPTVFEDK
jgi:outer membrane beta-barrel protein